MLKLRKIVNANNLGKKWDVNTKCSDIPFIRPPMVLVESGLNSEQSH